MSGVAQIQQALPKCRIVLRRTPISAAESARLNPDRATEQAIAVVHKLGGRFTRDEERPGRVVTRVNFSNTKATDADLEHLKGLTQLEWLWLKGTRVTDAGLWCLKGLTQLQRLDLDGTLVTDNGMEYLEELDAASGIVCQEHKGYRYWSRKLKKSISEVDHLLLAQDTNHGVLCTDTVICAWLVRLMR